MVNVPILETSQAYDRLRVEQGKGKSSPHYKLLKDRDFTLGPAVQLGKLALLAQITRPGPILTCPGPCLLTLFLRNCNSTGQGVAHESPMWPYRAGDRRSI
jgi:hypothetical protein